jgi:general secretion pathway protein D
VQKTGIAPHFWGDIPLVGRLFRTNAEQHIKRNLVIFVTARWSIPVASWLIRTKTPKNPKT